MLGRSLSRDCSGWSYAYEVRSLLQNTRYESGIVGVSRKVEERLGGIRTRVSNGKVEQTVGRVARLCRACGVVHPYPQIIAPVSLVCCYQLQRSARTRSGQGRSASVVVSVGISPVDSAHDDDIRAAVEEVLLHRVTHGALDRQATEGALVIGEALDTNRLVNRSPDSMAYEGRNRRRDTDDGTYPAWDLLNVDTRESGCDRH